MKRFPGGTRPHTVHDHVRDEAIAWLIGFCESEVDTEGRERFERWLKASPEHVQAYLQVSAFWEAAGRLNEARKLQIDELVNRAAAEVNVLKFEPAAERISPLGKSRLGKSLLGRVALAASLLLVAAAGIAGYWWQSHRASIYATGVGEERTLTLSDSSTIVLDARSKITVRYTQGLRTIDLLEGQALFRVAHNVARPFVVTAGGATIRDVGTQFVVRRDGAATVVTVLEGQVATFREPGSSIPGGRPTRGIYVSAGEQVTVAPRVVLRAVQVSAGVAAAWTEGKLVFDATPLSDVIEDFNRYSPRPLTIDDPQLLSLHVSGTFDARDSAQIIRFLSERFGLVAHESTNGIRLSRD
jgi:transmembrane sensor